MFRRWMASFLSVCMLFSAMPITAFAEEPEVVTEQECSHAYEESVTLPTCVDQGYTTFSCSLCGDGYVDAYVDALGHSWDEGVVTTESTESAAGVKIYTCTVCAETMDEEIPALTPPAVEPEKEPVAFDFMEYLDSEIPVIFQSGCDIVLADYIRMAYGLPEELSFSCEPASVSYMQYEDGETLSITLTANGDYSGTATVTGEVRYVNQKVTYNGLGNAFDILVSASQNGSFTDGGTVIFSHTFEHGSPNSGSPKVENQTSVYLQSGVEYDFIVSYVNVYPPEPYLGRVSRLYPWEFEDPLTGSYRSGITLDGSKETGFADFGSCNFTLTTGENYGRYLLNVEFMGMYGDSSGAPVDKDPRILPLSIVVCGQAEAQSSVTDIHEAGSAILDATAAVKAPANPYDYTVADLYDFSWTKAGESTVLGTEATLSIAAVSGETYICTISRKNTESDNGCTGSASWTYTVDIIAPESSYAVTVTAEDKSVIKGEEFPEFTSVITSVPELEGLSIEGLTYEVQDADGNAVSASELEVGEYSIVIKLPETPAVKKGDTFLALNGEISAVSGKLTVNKSILDSGTCGGDLTWEIDTNGVLTISGTGAMNDYTSGTDAPWYSSRSKIKSAVIEEGVTSIGSSAFYNCYDLTSITISDGVTNIGSSAFYNCYGLTSVAIPASVTSIGSSAFYGCSNSLVITYNGSIVEWVKLGVNKTVQCTNGTFSTYGLCGEDLVWCFDADDVLTIIGSGKMESYSSSSDTPWYRYLNTTKSVVIADGVTHIGSYAFEGCSSLTSVEIPDSVTSIGAYVFYNCSSLTSVEIPDSVTSIGAWTFEGCSSLTSVEIPNSVTIIGSWAFSGCSGLTSVTIGRGVTRIGNNAFEGCSGLTSVMISDLTSWCSIDYFNGYISGERESGNPLFNGASLYVNNELVTELVIPEDVTHISSYAFYNCSSLTSVEIPDSVTGIGYMAFEGCSGLTSVMISDLTSWCSVYFGNSGGNPLNNGASLYVNNELVTELVIPEDVTHISAYAFYNCSSLTSVEIPDSVTGIGAYAFQGCSSLTSVVIPDSVTSIGNNAFEGCSGLTSVMISDLTSWCSIDFGYSGGNPLNNGASLYVNDEIVTELVIPEDVTYISAYAFYGCSSLTSVEIPDSVTSIGSSAFRNCTGLTSVAIPASVTSIGSSAFYNCSSLTSVEIPDSVTGIGSSAFYNCSGLTSVTIGRGVTSIGSSAFFRCSGLTSVEIPDSVTSIGSSAFESCSSLTSVTIGRGVTSIGYRAFDTCYSLTSVVIPDSVTSIGDYAFYNCSGLTSVTIGRGVTSIGGYTFYNCDGLTSVTIPASVTSIGSYAFSSCSGLTSVVIPDSVTSIGSYAFRYCSNLSVINFGHSLNDKLSIGDGAFYADPPLFTKVNTPEGEEMHQAINVYDWLGSNRVLSAITGGCGLGLNWQLDMDGLLTISGSGAMDDYSSTPEAPWYIYRSIIESVVIEDGVTSIGDNAFGDNGYYAPRAGLTSVVIPDSVTSIGDNAFYNCSGLTSVVIPDSVTSIGDNAFRNCTGLTSMEIPGSVTRIGSYAFYNCSGLTSVTIGRGVTHIGDGAFSSCSGLTSVVIPDSVTRIGSYAFAYWASLTSVVIPDSVTSIGEYAFYRCSGLTSVTIGRGVTSIGSYAFYDCHRMNKIVFLHCYSDALTIGDSAFCIGSYTSTVVEVSDPANIHSNIRTYSWWSDRRYVTFKVRVVDSGNCGENVIWEFDSLGNLIIRGSGETIVYEKYEDTPWSAYDIKNVVIGSGVTANYAFPQAKITVENGAVLKIAEGSSSTVNGEIIVAEGGKFVNEGNMSFADEAKLTVEGTLENKGSLTVSGEIIVAASGKLVNDSSMNLADKAALTVEGTLENNGSLILSGESNLQINGVLENNSNIELAEDGRITVSEEAELISNGEITGKVENSEVLGTVSGEGLPKVTEIVISNSKNEVVTGSTVTVDVEQQSYQFKAFIEPQLAKKDIEWSSGDEEIATVDENGLVTFRRAGIVNIIVTAKDGSEVSSEVKLSIRYKGVAPDIQLSADISKYSVNRKPTSIGLQVGDRVQMNIFGEDETKALDWKLFEYSVEENDFITVDEKGIITAIKSGGSATVTAAFKGDVFGRTVTISVKTIPAQSSRVSILPYDMSDEAFVEVDANGDLCRESGLAPVSYALYVDKIPKGKPAQTYRITASAYGDPVKWSSSNTKLATVKENKDGSVYITVKANVDGACTITATSKYDSSAKGYISVYVVERSPRIGATSVTLDTQMLNVAELAVVASYGNAISSIEYLDAGYNKTTKQYSESSGKLNMSYDAVHEVVVFSANSVVKNQTVKGQLLIKTEQGEYRHNLNVVIKNKAPSVTIKQSPKFNIFLLDSQNEMTFTVKNEKLLSVALESSDFKGEWDGEKLTVSYKNATPPASPNTKLNVLVSLEGYAYPVSKAVTLSTATTKPSLSLVPASGTLNTAYGDRDMYISVYDNKAKADFDLSNSVLSCSPASAGTVKLEDGKIKFTAASGYTGGKLSISIKDANWLSPITLSFTLKVNSNPVTMKLKSSTLTVNKTFAKSYDVDIVPSHGNLDAAGISGTATAAKPNANTDKLAVWVESGKVYAEVLDNSIANGSYVYSIVPKYDDGVKKIDGLAAMKLTVKVASTQPKITLSKTTVSLNSAAGFAGNEIAVSELKCPAGYELIGCKVSSAVYGMDSKIFVSCDGSSVTAKINPNKLPDVGSYKFNIIPTVSDGVAEAELNPISLTVKVYYNAKTSATVKASGKIDAVQRESTGITYTLTKLTNVVGNVQRAELIGQNADMFELEALGTDAKGQHMFMLKLKEGKDVSTKSSYKVQIKYILDTGITVNSSVLTVKVSSSALKLAASPATQTIFQSQSRTRVVRYTVDLTSPVNAEIGKISIGSVGVLQRSLVNEDTNISVRISADGKSANVYVTVKDTSALAAGKTYTLPLVIEAEGKATNAATTKLSLKLKVAK